MMEHYIPKSSAWPFTYIIFFFELQKYLLGLYARVEETGRDGGCMGTMGSRSQPGNMTRDEK